METVKLKVTSKVIEQTTKAKNQEQIALTTCSDALGKQIALANRNNFIDIHLANGITLKLGDTGAIGRPHNKGNERQFDSLFRFLSEHPNKELEFLCSVSS